jgi:hypothetical protein
MSWDFFGSCLGLGEEHGVSVVFHPERGATWGVAWAIDSIEDRDGWHALRFCEERDN